MSNSVNNQPDRLYSLDALRGFDMFWIMGAEEIFHQLSKATGSPFWGAVSSELTHPAWNGFAMYDLIFPLFLFMAGVEFRPHSRQGNGCAGACGTSFLRNQGCGGGARRAGAGRACLAEFWPYLRARDRKRHGIWRLVTW